MPPADGAVFAAGAPRHTRLALERYLTNHYLPENLKL